MSLSEMLIIFTLGVISAAYILWPCLQLTNDFHTPDFLKRLANLLYEKERVLENLEELDQDLQLGKMASQDYSVFRARLMEEASEIYSQIEELEMKHSFLKESKP